jgi:diguanylate cyclase (GGDEF)-like protein/PAS domain S-box-containing protein
MALDPPVLVIPFILAAGISLLVALLILQRPNVRGGVALATLLLQFGLWAVANAVRVSLVDPADQVPWLRLANAVLAPAPLTALIFVAQLTSTDHWLSNFKLLLLFIEPLVAVVLIAMNEVHGLYYTSFQRFDIAGRVQVIAERGPWFWIHTGFSYVFITAAAITMVQALLRASPYIRTQLTTALIGSLLPWGANIFALLAPVAARRLAIAPVAVAASGLVFAYALFRRRLLDIAPVARSLLFEKLGDAVIVVDMAGRIVDLNGSARQAFHLGDDAYGRSLAEVVPQWREIAVSLEDQAPETQLEIQDLFEPTRFLELSLIPLLDSRGAGSGYLISMRDISERKRAEMEVERMNTRLRRQVQKISSLHEELREQAIRDALTGLYNRRYLDETLRREFSRARRGSYLISVILIDVDQFKRVNDTYGHKAGDRVLRQMGSIIRSHVRAGDIPCRFGGEEFVIVMPDTSLDTAYERAELLRQRFAATRFIKVQGGVNPTVSIGIAVYPAHGRSEERILHAADQAMYLAKARGGDQAVRYDSRQKNSPVPPLKVRPR